MLRIKKINPLENYKSQMKLVRKKYLKEFQENSEIQKTKSLENELKIKELEKKRVLDVTTFRKEKEVQLAGPTIDVDPKDVRKVSQKKIKLFQMTREELKNYYQDRSLDRFKRNAFMKKEQNQRKVDGILKLFYDSKSFVTYQNLEEKLESVVCVKNASTEKKFYSIKEMINSKVYKSDVHLEEKLEMRKQALQDVLYGTAGMY